MIFKRYQNLLTKCEKKSWFWHHILYFWKPGPEPGYPGFLESKPETRFFKTRPGFENTIQLIISTDCSSRLSLSQCFSNKINKPLGISRFWYYERLHFLTESNKSIFLRGWKFSIFVKKIPILQHYLLFDPAHLACI